MAKKKILISIVTPCYNEEGNVEELYKRVKEIFISCSKYQYEHIFIDNASADNTVSILKKIARLDKNVKIIVNVRNFGHIRSPYYGLLQANGDAVILMAADMQDPPEMIPKFLEQWTKGYAIVVGVKEQSEESKMFFLVRKLYYYFITKLSETKLIKNFTGFGLYDKKIILILRKIEDPYPYFRGLVCEIGYDIFQIPFLQPVRKKGFTKNNFYSLYDIAMLGITNHSKIPLRLATFVGFAISFFSLILAGGQVIVKFFFWDSYSIGISTLVVSLFFFASVQLIFIGILGEYLGSIHTQVMKRPLVIERERVNF